MSNSELPSAPPPMNITQKIIAENPKRRNLSWVDGSPFPSRLIQDLHDVDHILSTPLSYMLHSYNQQEVTSMKMKVFAVLMTAVITIGIGTVAYASNYLPASFKDMLPFMKEMHPQMNDTELEQMYNNCHSMMNRSYEG